MGLGIEPVSAAIAIGQQLGIGRKKREKREDNRQYEQQEKLNKLGIAGSKEMLDYQQNKEMEMWKATNWKAQMEQAEDAGLSKAWLMSKGGGGSASLGGGGMSVSGGSASDAASASNAESNKQQLGIQGQMMLAQIENMKADTEKKKAEASGLGQDNIGKERENLMIDETMEDYKKAFQRGLDVRIIEGEIKNAMWEFEKAVMYDNNFESKDSPKAQEFLNSVKIKAKEVEKISEEVNNLKKAGKNVEADTVLKKLDAEILDFKKVLTEYGINDTTANLGNLLLKAVLGLRGGRSK